MTKMATPDMASSEYFTVGSLVTCVTCLDSEVEGEVLAYDQHAKMLIISKSRGEEGGEIARKKGAVELPVSLSARGADLGGVEF